MKKRYIVLSIMSLLFLVAGCTIGKDLTNTPTKQVEMLLTKYQTLDKDVLNDLDKVVAEDENFDTKQREKYRSIMKKHYQDLVYTIKNETVNGDDAVVEVEIEVNNHADTLKKAEDYRKKNEKEFYKDEKFNAGLYIDYKLKELEKDKEKVKYTLEIPVTKKDGKWQVNNLSNDDKQKINGIYED